MARPARKSIFGDEEERPRSMVLVAENGRNQTMHHEHVEMTWTEAVTALAVMGIVTFLLLL
jgi:hypothetical protein